MKKYLLIGLIGMFAIALVVAGGYLVSSFVITTDVYEPFTVEYAIIGNAGNWDGVTNCSTYVGEWQEAQDVDVGGLFAGEARYVCTKITNAGEGDVDYTFSGEVTTGLGNLIECEDAFGEPSTSGTVLGLSEVKVGVPVMIPDNAPVVNDCKITLSVARG